MQAQAHWNHSSDMHLSSLGPESQVFTFWVCSGLIVGSGCSLMAAQRQVPFLPVLPQGSPAHCSWWLQLLMTDILWASQTALVVKNPTASAGDVRDIGLIPGSGRAPGGGHENPLQYSCLENLLDRGAWQITVHGVTKSRTQLKQT